MNPVGAWKRQERRREGGWGKEVERTESEESTASAILRSRRGLVVSPLLLGFDLSSFALWTTVDLCVSHLLYLCYLYSSTVEAYGSA